MLKEFGEVDDLFFNTMKHFCFVKFDFRPNAEKCKSRLGECPTCGDTGIVDFFFSYCFRKFITMQHEF